MGFWSGYRTSNRPSEVDELTDKIQRPIGYVIARLALPTPLTPNAITVMSMLFAVAAGVVWFMPIMHRGPIGAALLITAAMLDAADGQLARMRGTQSDLGRMLDGVADGVSAFAAVAGGMSLLWSKFSYDLRYAAFAMFACVITAWTGSMHTSMYDHYKNVWMCLTQDRLQEGEDYANALGRYRARKWSPLMYVTWQFYLGYVRSQELLIKRYDPYTTPSITRMPRYDARRGEIYKRLSARVMPYWKLFGFGMVTLGIAVFAALDALEYYIAFRLLFLHPLFYLWVRPMQQRVSREAFAEMGITIDPDVGLAT